MKASKSNKIALIKSPLRYPGGKSRAVKRILAVIPDSFKEYREPMVGGGGVFLALKQKFPDREFSINDINTELYLFWEYCKENGAELIQEINKIKKRYSEGKDLYSFLTKEDKNRSDFQRAVRFFILNRITFSGLIESGGYSDESFRKRFTNSSIFRLSRILGLLKNVSITNDDYEKMIRKKGKDVFIFLDPPYYSSRESKLYGKNGNLHKAFDHERFASLMKKCQHKWLITYDDAPEIRKLFNFAHVHPWKLQYGMNNYKQKFAAKGKELFISNYELEINE